MAAANGVEPDNGGVKVPAKSRAKAPVQEPVSQPPKAKMGRPRKVIIADEFEKLCRLQCTQEEICGWFGVSEDTLTRWCKATYADENGKPMTFAETYKVYSKDGRISLRRLQFKHAEKSAAMAMFLGKVYLNQREDAEIDRSLEQSGPPLIINYNYGSPEVKPPKEGAV